MNSRKEKDKFADARKRMLAEDITGRGITDAGVLKAMSDIERKEFVPEAYHSQAYADGPLPIGMGQTISQPYIVALMTQQLRVSPYCEVLEIGTGSGYQTAILSRLAKKVYTIERFSELSESAQAILGRLGIANVEFCVGDGSCGWPGEKTFDRVIITAAVPSIPTPLIEQLKESGLLIAPVGYSGVQELRVCEKRHGQIMGKNICEVRFVRLVGKCGFEE